MRDWVKRALIPIPKDMQQWAKSGGLQPTPLILENAIRVFAGFRDQEGVSRIGYIDLNLKNPCEVVGYSKNPILDIGQDGSFDDNGVVPSAVLRKNSSEVMLHYAGYQLHKKTRFSVFGGLALSSDDGLCFTRFKKTPLLERTPSDLLFRVAHSVLYDNDMYRVWYGGGDHFKIGKDKPLPVYNIRYMESLDGLSFPVQGEIVLDITGDQHRLGRPYVFKYENVFFMFFGEGSESDPYRLAYAQSKDGCSWEYKGRLNMSGAQDWDGQMSAYPAVVNVHDAHWLIYNGNNYGESGFIIASKKIEEA